ncbi:MULTISPECIES: acyl carrier protein [unclassified Streptomyces]|uniref:acyl carrier protein n=1 Tax=unclassified Streptomyces TaxID=2593676 RepID=UPI00364A20DF
MSTLEKIVGDILGLPEDAVDDTTGMKTVGAWTSLRHVQIIAVVQREYGVRITPRQARSCRSVADLRDLIPQEGHSA